MSNAKFTFPDPVNEPILSYLPGSPEKKALKAQLEKFYSEQIEIPLIIGGKEVRTGKLAKAAFASIISYIEYAKNSSDATIIAGGNYNDSKGYFIEPTVILTTDPHFKTMQEEIFGPVITIYVYPDNEYEKTLEICDSTSPYGLTGSIIAKDRHAINVASKALMNAAGNFYINDKPTGAVVGQQPFGGSRASGTNDKAGSMINLLRWVSPRATKENFVPPKDYRYPFMVEG